MCLTDAGSGGSAVGRSIRETLLEAKSTALESTPTLTVPYWKGRGWMAAAWAVVD